MKHEIRSTHGEQRRLFNLYVAGESVSHLVVHDLAMWVQGTRVPAGGVGGVTTKPEHRRRGYCAALMEEAIGFMEDEGYLLSLLFGIPDFYDRFGYAPFAASWTLRVAVDDADRWVARASRPAACAPRPLSPLDTPFVVGLYNDLSRRREASMARDPERFRGFRWGTYVPGVAAASILEAEGEERVAYFAVRRDQPFDVIIEAAVVHPRWYTSLLGELVRRARQEGQAELVFDLPDDDPFARALLPCGCRGEAVHHRSSGAMLRVIDRDALLDALGIPRSFGGTVSNSALGQVVTGYRPMLEWATEAPGAGGMPGGQTTAGRLVPFIWQADRF